MEAGGGQEEVTMGSNKEQQSHIAKGKRTKRQRPQSPIPFPITTTNSLSLSPHTDDNYIPTTTFSPSTTSTTDFHDPQHEDEEEEEDMANCLILLAQGQSPADSCKPVSVPDQDTSSNFKFNSRKFLESTTGSAGKTGYYVYECKTCSRTFPSFQALGGHRASHKKPKAMAVDHEKKQFGLLYEEEEEDQLIKNKISTIPSPVSLQLSNTINNKSLYGKSSNNKVHECSICGAEFTSGQALGGHMRRHRSPIGTSTTALSLTPIASDPDEQQQQQRRQHKRQRSVLSLDLDLNLPAPEDDHHHRESKFVFSSKQQQEEQQQRQQSSLLFASPSLVDCHY